MDILNNIITQKKLYDHTRCLFNKALLYLKNIVNFFYYKVEIKKNFYPCRLAGEFCITEKGETVITYKIFGHRNKFNISIKDIFADKKLMEKFHSSDVAKISFLAFGEIFFSLQENERLNKFVQIKKQIFDKNG